MNGFSKYLITPVLFFASFCFGNTDAKVSHHVFDALADNPIVFHTRAFMKQPVAEHIPLEVSFFDLTPAVLSRISEAGIVVNSVSEEYQLAGLTVSDTSQVRFLASLPEIQHVYEAHLPLTRAGAVDGDALKAMGIDSYSSGPEALTGEGVHIGIISDSFAKRGARAIDQVPPALHDTHWPVVGDITKTIPQLSGDAPAVVYSAYDELDLGNVDEGAAMAELIHDIAPGAKISFHSAGKFKTDFAEAINHLCKPETEQIHIPYWPKRNPSDQPQYSHGTDSPIFGRSADIVVDDIGFITSLIYQDDVIALAAQDCYDSGKLYVAAAGNDGDSAIRENYSHTQMLREYNHPTLGAKAYGHNWGTQSNPQDSLEITLASKGAATIVLHWNQPSLSVQNPKINPPLINFDLVVRDSETGNIVNRGTSSNLQNNGMNSADPWELVTLQNIANSPKKYLVQIYHTSGNTQFIPQNNQTPIEFSMMFLGLDSSQEIDPLDEYPKFSRQLSGPTMLGQNLAKGVISVAAVPYFESPNNNQSGGATSEIDPEPFSSKGGILTKQFDRQGNFNVETVRKPNFSAVDGVNTSFFGKQINDGDNFPNFFGTSAAAPNAAAVAALLIEASGDSYTNQELKNALTCSTIDVKGARSSQGWDSVTGSGLLVMSLPKIGGQPVVFANPGSEISLNPAVTSQRPITDRKWEIVEGSPHGELVDTNGSLQVSIPMSGVNFELKIRLTVKDQCGLINRKEFTVKAAVDTTAPEIDITNDYIDGLDAFKIDASVTDSESQINSISWKQMSGPDATLVQEQNGTLEVTPSSPGVYAFEVTALNNAGLSTKKLQRIVVIEALPPIIAASSEQAALEIGTTHAGITVSAKHPTVSNSKRITELTIEQLSGPAANFTKVKNPTGSSSSEYKIVANTTDQSTQKFRISAVVKKTGAKSEKIITIVVKASESNSPNDSDKSSKSSGGSIHSFFILILSYLAYKSRRKYMRLKRGQIYVDA